MYLSITKYFLKSTNNYNLSISSFVNPVDLIYIRQDDLPADQQHRKNDIRQYYTGLKPAGQALLNQINPKTQKLNYPRDKFFYHHPEYKHIYLSIKSQ